MHSKNTKMKTEVIMRMDEQTEIPKIIVRNYENKEETIFPLKLKIEMV